LCPRHMKRIALACLALFTFTGCVASTENDEETESVSEELNAATLRGYFEYDRVSHGSRWLIALALHDDGTFEADVGNNIGNLSGHHHPASGTFTLVSAQGGAVLTLKYDFAGPDTDRYNVKVQGNSVKMKMLELDDTEWFGMKKEKAATLTFNADWSVKQDGPLVAGKPLIVRYAAKRNPCTLPPNGWFSTDLNAAIDGRRSWIVQGFPGKPVNGLFGSVGRVPHGHHLALWFKNGAINEDSSPACSAWDSKFGANYTFSVQQH